VPTVTYHAPQMKYSKNIISASRDLIDPFIKSANPNEIYISRSW
jgi:hypothetical protein